MTINPTCPECGAELPPDAPRGLCPGCLLNAGISAVGGDRGGSEAVTSARADAITCPAPAELAEWFPHLEIVDLLGQGGMGAVYKARQRGLDRPVALKILTLAVSQDPSFAERFAREARALAKLSHPHIVAVYDSGQAGGRYYYFLMELVEGIDLRQALRNGDLTPAQALAIVPQICEALQYAHDEGVVHRDIKPENILIDRKGRVKIADFGLAKLVDRAASDVTLTAPQQTMGTLHYMAPEQWASSREVDHRADIYSLGVVFYELLTGELPLGRFAPPSQKVRVDVRIDEVVLRALEREPRRRYQQASEVKSDVEMIAGGTPRFATRVVSQAHASALPAGTGPRLLTLAISLVICLLTMTAGIALLIAGLLTMRVDSGEFWGLVGGAFGCFFGGGGGLVGTWNSYRQMEGAPDLMSVPGWTWLDLVLGAYTLMGLCGIVLAVGLSLTHTLGGTAAYSLSLLGGIAFFQGALFVGYRTLMRRAARQDAVASKPGKDERESVAR